MAPKQALKWINQKTPLRAVHPFWWINKQKSSQIFVPPKGIEIPRGDTQPMQLDIQTSTRTDDLKNISSQNYIYALINLYVKYPPGRTFGLTLCEGEG
jgi:hypothetical protein